MLASEIWAKIRELEFLAGLAREMAELKVLPFCGELSDFLIKMYECKNYELRDS